MALNIVKRLVPKFVGFDKPIEVIVDGGYAKDTVLLPLKDLCNVTTITRLRRDAVVFEVPLPRKKGQRGRLKTYDDRIDMKAMAESKHGWATVECWQYCPWDDVSRRPSHADRRNFLRCSMLLNEFNAALASQSITNKLKSTLKILLNLAV